jgi:hypothetical protein
VSGEKKKLFSSFEILPNFVIQNLLNLHLEAFLLIFVREKLKIIWNNATLETFSFAPPAQQKNKLYGKAPVGLD